MLSQFAEILGPGHEESFVELIDVMPTEDADLAVVEAARTSYKGTSKGWTKDLALLTHLLTHDHTSTMEHVVFKFRIQAPVVVWWQMLRHRMASPNLQSGRYTEYPEDNFYVPEYNQWRLQSKTNKQGSNGYLEDQSGSALSLALRETIRKSMGNYQIALSFGVAKEQARFFLPAWVSYHTGIFTINARSLVNLLQLRDDDHAQWEIRQYAIAMKKAFKEQMPNSYEILFGVKPQPKRIFRQKLGSWIAGEGWK